MRHFLSAVTVVGLLSMPIGAGAASAQTYGEIVPDHLRDLVTETMFAGALKTMTPAVDAGLRADIATAAAASPCAGPISTFTAAIFADPLKYGPILDRINAEFVDPPAGYHMVNPWRVGGTNYPWAALTNQVVSYFTDWCVFLPQIDGDQDNGLKFILGFAWFYYQNPAGQMFSQGLDPFTGAPDRVMSTFLQSFTRARGVFMDSPASTRYVAQWIADPRIEIADYQKKLPSDFASWNAFFARKITVDAQTQTIPSRPTTMPDRSYVVSAPTDCIMNPLVQRMETNTPAGMVRALIDNPLELNTVIDVKDFPISVDRLLGSAASELKAAFVGGTGVACVLMPNTYHHFHTPVSGTIVHSEIVRTGTYGYYDFPNWVPQDGIVGRLGTDFSQFEVFQRGVVIIKIQYTGARPGEILQGYVASIPVGLDTIGSVVLNPQTTAVGASVKRGYTELGNFFYGGSLNILLFSKGIASPAIQVRLGNQIAILDAGTTPD